MENLLITPFYQNSIIFIDFWTFAHLILAILLILIISIFIINKKRKIKLFMLIIITWEFIEFNLYRSEIIPSIHSEPAIDIIWDIIIGILGLFIGLLILKQIKKFRKNKKTKN